MEPYALRANQNQHTWMLENKDIKRWYDNVARGSLITADVYLRRLGNFCQNQNLTQQKLLSMPEEELYNLFLDTVTRMQSEGYAGSYIHSTIKALKSWLIHNRIQIKGRIKIEGAQDAPTLKDERVPTKPELKRIFLKGDEKARTICSLIAHGGLRPETIGDYKGRDGLKVRDLPELTVKNNTVTFSKAPSTLIVRSNLSKAGHQYFTFISEETCQYIKDYLEARLRAGETITAESAIVTPKQRMKPFIRTANVGDAARNCIRGAGFTWRPYVLRSYFDTQLMLAESKGFVIRDYRQFWMGHAGDIENRYTTNKQRLPESVLEDMREAYLRSQEFLQTIEKPTTSKELLAQSFREQLLLVAGFNKEEMAHMDAAAMSDDKLQELVRKKLLGSQANVNVKQKAVHISEVSKYLSLGWEYVANLPDKQVVIRINT
jgi:hypothetical protein